VQMPMLFPRGPIHDPHTMRHTTVDPHTNTF